MVWTKVLPKRSSFRWDVFPFGGSNRSSVQSVVTSFYVSEFPDFFNAKRLFELFGCSGNVTEVDISPRRNRYGKRFAFARFLDVEDGRVLAVCLDNILIEGKKLHVNLPRFGRIQGVVPGRLSSFDSKGCGGRLNPVNGVSSGIVGLGVVKGVSRSYAEVVGAKGQVSRVKIEELAVLNFQSDVAVKSRFEKAYVGRVCIPGSSYNIQNYLEMEGVFSTRVTPLGGNICLLEEVEKGFIGDLIKEGESWWKSWFTGIEKWKPGMLDGRRDAWFRIYGIPIHAWCSDFFLSLGELWRRFLCMDDNTSKGKAFDIARILVNIPLSLCIPDYVPVSIDGVIFKLCIREDVHSMYRHVEGNHKLQSSDGDTSDSDSERLPVESDSGCSEDSEGIEIMEAHKFGDLIKKDVVLLDDLCKRHSGVTPESGTRGKFVASSEVGTDGNCNSFVGSASRSASDSDEFISKALVEPEEEKVNLLDTRNRVVTSRKGQSVLMSEFESAPSGNCILVGSEVSSEPAFNSKSDYPMCLIPVDGKAHFLRNSGKGIRKEVTSGLSPDGSIPCVGSLESDNSVGSSKFGSGEAGGSEVKTSEDASDSDSISASFTAGGISKALLANDSGSVRILSTSNNGGSVNCLIGETVSVREGTAAVVNSNVAGDSYCNQGADITIGNSGGRNINRKVILKCDHNLVGKKNKSRVGRSTKGDTVTPF